MRKKIITLHSISNIIICILSTIFLILTIHTTFIIFKLNKAKSIPRNSINVSPEIDESFKPTFNKTIHYLGSDNADI